MPMIMAMNGALISPAKMVADVDGDAQAVDEGVGGMSE